jgi:hypothetical protein
MSGYMDSILTILGNKDFDEPPEINKIKEFIRNEYGVSIGVQVREKDIILSVPDASLANTLRLNQQEIKKEAKTEKRLTFRIVG